MAEYRGSKKRSRQSETPSEVAFVEGILIAIFELLRMLFNGFGGGSKVSSGVGRTQIRDGWERVELHVLQDATAALAISEADKLVDAAFQTVGIRGTTMGERLKNAESRLSGGLYQRVWEAHKLRNALAHEVGVQVSAAEAKQAVATFREALYKLGIL